MAFVLLKKKFENWGCIFKSIKILMDLKNIKKLKFSQITFYIFQNILKGKDKLYLNDQYNND